MAAVPPVSLSNIPTTPAVVFAVGVNHRTAPSELRERLYVAEDAVPAALAGLRQAGLTQAILLSTCDRTEIIGCHRDAAEALGIAVGELARLGSITTRDLTGHLLVLQGEAAIEHLFAVAASLDSVVIGEPQVLGQVHEAFRLAGEFGLVGSDFGRLMQAAFATAKRVRSETAIGRRSISMASAALQVAREVHGQLDRCAALFIGAGEMGELLAAKLRESGLGRLAVADSLALRAQATARRLSAQIVPFGDLTNALTEADIVLCGLGHGTVVIDAALMRAVLRRRRQRPVFLIDAAVPGDIAASVNEIDEAFLYNLADLERIAQEGREQREQEAAKGWAILREATASYVRQSASREGVPALAALRAHFEAARAGLLTEQPGLAADEATRLLINRLLHRPSEALRRAAAEGADRATLEALLGRLFEIEPESSTPRASGAVDDNQEDVVNLDEKLHRVVARQDELGDALAAGKVEARDFARVSKEYAELTPVVTAIQKLRKLREELAGLDGILADATADPEMKSLAEEERAELAGAVPKVEHEIKLLLIPKDEADERNAILEVRAGAGGDEAALFASELFRMYQRYSDLHGWKFELMSLSENDIGGFKEATGTITGRGVFARLKFESGVHRVQRVPATEGSGRIHTSTATVAVLPEAEEVDIQIDEKDLRIDVFRASGPGGQSVNTTDSAVRITHIPTGVVVQQQDEKSQHKNKAKALKVLRARLYEAKRNALDQARAANRKSQVGTGDRSERIRTYNFPQGRVTDHRINLTLYNIDKVVAGSALDEVIEALVAEDQAERLAELQ